MKTTDIVTLFKDKGLKSTPQRIAVYKFLDEHRTHPDVETVYEGVSKDNPAFSKTTVYNCLQALSECGLLMPIKIDNEKIR
jgi:Fur family peroxide stress response transcriptional regulator